MADHMELPIHKDLRKLCRDAKRRGFSVSKRGSGHFLLAHPAGPSFTISSTPNQNAIRDARRSYTRALSQTQTGA